MAAEREIQRRRSRESGAFERGRPGFKLEQGTGRTKRGWSRQDEAASAQDGSTGDAGESAAKELEQDSGKGESRRLGDAGSAGEAHASRTALAAYPCVKSRAPQSLR